MAIQRITADTAIERLASFDAVIDARSESEFAEDRLPGARNWPSLDDAERAEIGTVYKQVSAFEARKRGAVLVARNIARHLEQHVVNAAPALPREWAPLVYCWRGGQRSGALATVLDAIGFRVHVLEGGYREFRRAVLRELEVLPARLGFHVLCGRTGSGKSRLLGVLAEAGAQVLDLEALASHRGSVLGPLPGQPQPSQKAFETALWTAMRRFDPARAVWAESESRTIGRLRVPEALLERLRAAPCLAIEMPLPARVRLLLQDYGHFVQDTESFCERLAALRELRGAETVGRWQALARAGDHAQVVEELLLQHYDPIYQRSMSRNYAGFAAAQPLELRSGDEAELAAAARALCALHALRAQSANTAA
ncbi:MAG: tRNA 2-selenouridine(34) synthase MnmH [Burkholderiales bacterium]|nr:tRNA 2-selenouridine(34) synthase MnmH [Burkholderiales bacterium]